MASVRKRVESRVDDAVDGVAESTMESFRPPYATEPGNSKGKTTTKKTTAREAYARKFNGAPTESTVREASWPGKRNTVHARKSGAANGMSAKKGISTRWHRVVTVRVSLRVRTIAETTKNTRIGLTPEGSIDRPTASRAVHRNPLPMGDQAAWQVPFYTEEMPRNACSLSVSSICNVTTMDKAMRNGQTTAPINVRRDLQERK